MTPDERISLSVLAVCVLVLIVLFVCFGLPEAIQMWKAALRA